MRVADAVAVAANTLDEAHVGSPRADAEWLAAFVLGVRRSRLAAVADFTAEQAEKFLALVARRAQRIPLQYLVGTAAFRHLEVPVGEGVFVPRPETEVMVDWGLTWLGKRPGGVVVDLCSGSGAIAMSMAAEAPGSHVYAVERDPAALGWLRRNLGEFGQAGIDVTAVAGDAVDPATLADLDGTVDLVLSNPPYVPEVAAASLPPEVNIHDPHYAVFGGRDGLDVIRPLIGRIAGLLRPGGAFAIEHDDTHAYVVPALVDADGRFDDIRLHHDLARRPRFTTATRTA